MSRSLNVSPVSYARWLCLVFDHPVPPLDPSGLPDVRQEWCWQEGVEFHVSNPTRLIEHMTRLCREFKSVADSYTLEQINQGIWFLLSASLNFGEYLADREVPLEKRLECVRAMYGVYADFVAPSEVEVMENCFDMWWDMLCSNFWHTHLWRLKGEAIMAQMEREDKDISPEEEAWHEKAAPILSQLKPDEDAETALQAHGLSFTDFPPQEKARASTEIDIGFEDLEPSEQQIMDAMLETLTRILNLDDERCQDCALHGLNHLNHPQRAQTVQNFIDLHRSAWDEEALSWLESCRDGKAM